MAKRPELAPAQARQLGKAQAAVDAATAASAKSSAALGRAMTRQLDFLAKEAPELVRAMERERERQTATAKTLSAAVKARDELAAKHMARLPIGRTVLMAGWMFERTQTNGRRSFRIADYLDKGKHPITPEMKPFYGAGEPSDHLSIRRASA